MMVRFLPLVVTTLLLPLAGLGVYGGLQYSKERERRAREEQVAKAKLEARMQAQLAAAGVCEMQHEIETYLLQIPRSAQSWPEQGIRALDELKALSLKAQAELPQLKATALQMANGDFSPATAAEMRRAGDVLLNYGREFQRLHDEIKRVQTEVNNERSLQAARAADKRKRETGYGLGLTREGYEFLKQGMSKWEVDLILDCTGEEHSRAGSYATYHWGQGFKGVTATFAGGQLVSKAQLGL